MANITPSIPADRKVIDGYRTGGFRVGGVRYEGSLIVFPDRVVPWPVARFEDITAESLGPVLAADPPVETLLVGCGERLLPLPNAVKALLREAGIGVDVMDTGAACRTHLILLSEARRVAAALVAL